MGNLHYAVLPYNAAYNYYYIYNENGKTNRSHH